jgi:hypothetical protein
MTRCRSPCQSIRGVGEVLRNRDIVAKWGSVKHEVVQVGSRRKFSIAGFGHDVHLAC